MNDKTRLFARKLSVNSALQVIAPSRSLQVIPASLLKRAQRTLENLQFKVKIDQDELALKASNSASIASRIRSIHNAFETAEVDGIITALGGYSANQLLGKIDFDLIRAHPKIFCGYSDITVLANAIFAKTGLVTYYGPHFSCFGVENLSPENTDYFLRAVRELGPYRFIPSGRTTDQKWLHLDRPLSYEPSHPYLALQPGKARGRIVGGHLGSLLLLHGTEFMPSLTGAILFLEADDSTSPAAFDRELQSLLYQPGAEALHGLIIGRFQRASMMSVDLLKEIVGTKPELQNLPVAANVDFGHTFPMYTFPIGGDVEVEISDQEVSITIVAH
ncbi:MAG: LD-carboxypeptidase [Oligoflexia bacterium]|nr:LD-carboxypeptidase [Oligoflexia bacterium]